MTPLASYLANQITARPKHREHIWKESQNLERLRRELDGIHCFEITQCLPLFFELAGNFAKDIGKSESIFEAHSFLPAPKTWLEWKDFSGSRVALLCEEVERCIPEWRDHPRVTRCTFFCQEMAEHAGYLSQSSGDYYDGHPGDLRPRGVPADLIEGLPFEIQNRFFPMLLSYGHVCLVLINSPGIIGREEHKPNNGLRKRLAKSAETKSFKLHDWTEIKLQVTKPREIDDGEPHTDQLTGKRALHFCRKHIRIRLGKLEYVRAHWRGDPAIGIKQSRYVVAP